MKNDNFKSIVMLVFEMVLIASVSLLMNKLNLDVYVCFFIYLVLLLEVLWLLRYIYVKDSINSKCIAIISFVMLGVLYFAYIISKSFVAIPNVYATAYMLLQGYFFMTGCLIVSKRIKCNIKAVKVISGSIYILSIVMAFLALFDIVN